MVNYKIDNYGINKRNQMQFARNIVPAVLAAFCLALAVAGCGQKDNTSAPPSAAAPTAPNPLSLQQQDALHNQPHGAAGKPRGN
jgi:predicted small lipoprotein YifL